MTATDSPTSSPVDADTPLGDGPPAQRIPEKIRVRKVERDQVIIVAGSAVAMLALTWLL